jgi:hypothetical protein
MARVLASGFYFIPDFVVSLSFFLLLLLLFQMSLLVLLLSARFTPSYLQHQHLIVLVGFFYACSPSAVIHFALYLIHHHIFVLNPRPLLLFY